MDEVRRRPELPLLVTAARPRLGPEVAERIRTLSSEHVDWPNLLQLAAEHGVRPLLYRSLSTACPDTVPSRVLEELLGFVRADVAQNLLQNGELVSLLTGLSERGIPAIPFKGSILADWAYADPALRESGDIDIVIRGRHLREAIGFLLTREYRARSEVLQEKLEKASDQHLGRYFRFDRVDGLASVDLQTSLESSDFSFTFDSDTLWERAVQRTFAGCAVMSFCAEDLLVLLCVHGTKDVWFKLKWICDIAAFIEREDSLDWDRVLVRATRLRARRKLLLGCVLAHDLLDLDLPPAILTRARKEPAVLASAMTVVGKYTMANRRYTDAERTRLYYDTADLGERTTRRAYQVRGALGDFARGLRGSFEPLE